MEKEAREFTAQDYMSKIKDSCQIKSNVDTKFYQGETGKDITVTVNDLLKKKKTTLYWKGCKNSQFKVVQNVNLVKVLIEDCHDCVFYLNGPITTSVVEIWRCNNCVIHIDTEVFTMQLDLSNNLTLTYSHKMQLGSIVQAGIHGLRINFVDYPELSFDSGFDILKLDTQYHDRNPPLDDKFDQFITRFVEGKLLTELIIRDSTGFHTTDREQDDFDDQKNKNDKATEEQIRKMLKLAGPAVGINETDIAGKSKEGKAEQEEKIKKEAASNMKKTAGNRAFTQGKYDQAIQHYSEAIEILPENHVLYSNRSAAYMQIKDWDKALLDAEKCISLDSHFPKGHFRKGQIMMELNKKQEALVSLKEARDLAPKDEEILTTIAKCEKL